MRCLIHVITDSERVVDPDGSEFVDLEAARHEASQSARDLMAGELLAGRPVPLGWRVQIAAEDGTILATIPFSGLVFGDKPNGHLGSPVWQLHDPALVERAKATFVRARQQNDEIRAKLGELRSQVRRLGQFSAALGIGSGPSPDRSSQSEVGS